MAYFEHPKITQAVHKTNAVMSANKKVIFFFPPHTLLQYLCSYLIIKNPHLVLPSWLPKKCTKLLGLIHLLFNSKIQHFPHLLCLPPCACWKKRHKRHWLSQHSRTFVFARFFPCFVFCMMITLMLRFFCQQCRQ